MTQQVTLLFSFLDYVGLANLDFYGKKLHKIVYRKYIQQEITLVQHAYKHINQVCYYAAFCSQILVFNAWIHFLPEDMFI